MCYQTFMTWSLCIYCSLYLECPYFPNPISKLLILQEPEQVSMSEESCGLWCVLSYFAKAEYIFPCSVPRILSVQIGFYLYPCFSSFHIVVEFCGNGCFVNINSFQWGVRFFRGQAFSGCIIVLSPSEAFHKSSFYWIEIIWFEPSILFTSVLNVFGEFFLDQYISTKESWMADYCKQDKEVDATTSEDWMGSSVDPPCFGQSKIFSPQMSE